jgi:filamentous hemagglutinin
VTSVINRYYDPTSDEFLSIDPDFAETDQPYVFTNDNPLNAEDPLGLSDINVGSPEGSFDVVNAGSLINWGDLGGDTAGSASEGTGTSSVSVVEGGLATSSAESPDALSGDEKSKAQINQEIDVSKLKLSGTNEQHATEYAKSGTLARPYMNSPLTIQNIVDAGEPIADPGGVPGALRWDVPGAMNGTSGTWELVIDATNETVLHFQFKSGG